MAYALDYENAVSEISENLPLVHTLILPITIGEDDTAETLAAAMATEEFPVIYFYMYDSVREAWNENPVNVSSCVHMFASNTTTEGEGQDAVDTVHGSFMYIRPVEIVKLAVDFDDADVLFFDPDKSLGCYVIYNPTDHTDYNYINELDAAFDETLIAKNAPWILEEAE